MQTPSTGHTPFELDYGQHPNTPSSLAAKKNTQLPAAEDFLNHWNTMIQIAKDTLMSAQERQAKYSNQRDKVLLSTRHITTPIDKNRPTKKLSPKYMGPYTIIAVISTTAYKLDLPENLKIHPVFHVSLLKHYQETSDNFNRPTPTPAIIIPGIEEEEYEVKNILGYPLDDATWKPAEHLKNAERKVKEFELTRTSKLREGRM
nr:14373_t:CDS:2 [Entrophospora candida]